MPMIAGAIARSSESSGKIPALGHCHQAVALRP
jgi:hypothetical protein